MTWQDMHATQASLAAIAMAKKAEDRIVQELSALVGATLTPDAVIHLKQLGRLSSRHISGVEIFYLDEKPFLSIGQPEIRMDGLQVTVTQKVMRIHL